VRRFVIAVGITNVIFSVDFWLFQSYTS